MMTKKNQSTIIIDTREQDPFDFENMCNPPTIREKLCIGDYSILGYEHRFCVERKTIPDLIQTIIYDRERFASEIRRRKYPHSMIIVIEGSIEDIYLHNYQSDIEPKAIIASCVAIQSTFHVPVNFCSTRQLACYWTYEFLMRNARRYYKHQS